MEICSRDRDLASSRFIPFDLAPRILSKLPLRCIIKFKSVSRSWRDLIESRLFVLLHLSAPSPHLSYLVVSSYSTGEILEARDDGAGCNVFPTKIANFTFRTAYSPIQAPLHSSVNGLILMGRHQENLIICNPITREFINLPRHWSHDDLGKSCLGFGVTRKSNQYKVVMISEIGYQVYTLGTGIWRTTSEVEVEAPQAPTPPPLQHECVHVGGNLYFLDLLTGTEVCCFDLETEALTASFSAPRPRHPQCYHRSLSVLNERLCMCDVYKKGSKGVDIHMWVMRGDGEWRKEYLIRDDDKCSIMGQVYPIKVTRDGGLLVREGGMRKVLYYSSKKSSGGGGCRRLYPTLDTCQRYLHVDSTAVDYAPTFIQLKELLMGKRELVQSF